MGAAITRHPTASVAPGAPSTHSAATLPGPSVNDSHCVYPTTPPAARAERSALNHLRTTLRAALNVAVREELIDSNPARHIEIYGYRRPHAQVWTEGRVEHWERTGEHPEVAVWTTAQLATFLESVVDDSLFAFWWLAALRGLRRGEICGLR